MTASPSASFGHRPAPSSAVVGVLQRAPAGESAPASEPAPWSKLPANPPDAQASQAQAGNGSRPGCAGSAQLPLCLSFLIAKSGLEQPEGFLPPPCFR